MDNADNSTSSSTSPIVTINDSNRWKFTTQNARSLLSFIVIFCVGILAGTASISASGIQLPFWFPSFVATVSAVSVGAKTILELIKSN